MSRRRSTPASPEGSISGKTKTPLVRQPAVAGTFYPDEKRPLADLVDRFADRHPDREEAIAVVAPHGGYLTCGAVAGCLYSRVKCSPVAVILGPKHTGVGKPLSLMTHGTWKTPLGGLSVQSDLAKAILEESRDLEEDALAHRDEHSIELQLPFLQRLAGVRSFVPILLGPVDPKAARRIGMGIARAVVRHTGQGTLLVASCALTRYEPQEAVRAKDELAIRRLLTLDPEGMLNAVEQGVISMCGALAVAAVLAAANGLGATRAKLVKYQTSGDVTGEYDSVVGYAGITIR